MNVVEFLLACVYVTEQIEPHHKIHIEKSTIELKVDATFRCNAFFFMYKLSRLHSAEHLLNSLEFILPIRKRETKKRKEIKCVVTMIEGIYCFCRLL